MANYDGPKNYTVSEGGSEITFGKITVAKDVMYDTMLIHQLFALRDQIDQLNAEIERMDITEARIFKRGFFEGVNCACLSFIILTVIGVFIYYFK